MKSVIPVLLTLCLMLFSGCATTDMRDAADSPAAGAIVKSRSISREHYRDLVMFAIIDGRPVNPGIWRAPAYMEVTISEGSHAITFDMERHVGLFADAVGASGELMFNAKLGRTYVMNTSDAEGLVRIWIEDEATGERVSAPVVRPLRRRSHNGGMMPVYIRTR